MTFLDGTWAYRRRPTEVIVCAFSRSYIIPVKKLVQQIDPDAFIMCATPTRSWARASAAMIPRDCKPRAFNICEEM